MWGIVLLFIGGVLLLENFHIIDFYWRNVWRFWPIFLIIAGVNILFNRNKSQIGGIVSIAILVVTLGVLFYKGQQAPESKRWADVNIEDSVDFDNNDTEHLSFSHPFTDSASTKTVLNVSLSTKKFNSQNFTQFYYFFINSNFERTFKVQREAK